MKITKFYINKFRSLVNFKVDKLDATTIFYGENNAGKSNILKALEIIFKRKSLFEGNELTLPKIFYEGFIDDFSYNFYNNEEISKIDFLVEVIIKKSDLDIKNTIKSLFKVWPEELKFTFEGIFLSTSLSDDLAEMQTNEIKVNNVTIYKNDSGSIKMFGSLLKKDNTNASELSEAFAHFLDIFNDCVYIIGKNRYAPPTEFNNNLINEFSTKEFTSSLYSLSLDDKKYKIFDEINSVFNEFPFSFGKISFARIEDQLELMIKKDEIRLPIKYLGSGVEQILFILTSIIYTKRKIVCIEELEQNLSPKLQNLALRKLQTLIDKNLSQIILSSHSSVFSKVKLSDAIYLIEKEKTKTIVAEKLAEKYGNKLKKHFVDSAPPIDTYTKEDFEEAQELAEKRFKM